MLGRLNSDPELYWERMAYLPGEHKKELFFGREIEVEVLDEKDKKGRMLGKLPSGTKIVLDEHFFLEDEKDLAPA